MINTNEQRRSIESRIKAGGFNSRKEAPRESILDQFWHGNQVDPIASPVSEDCSESDANCS